MKKCITNLDRFPEIIRKHADLLCLLSKAGPKEARRIIEGGPAGLLRALSLISYNVINHVFPISAQHLRKLTPYAKNFRRLAKKTLSTKHRRVELLKAGFLPQILGLVGSFLAPKLLKTIFK